MDGQQRQRDVSIPAPVKGASRHGHAGPVGYAGFNSCPREGGIGGSCGGWPSGWSFNSCPREGGIALNAIGAFMAALFQFLPP